MILALTLWLLQQPPPPGTEYLRQRPSLPLIVWLVIAAVVVSFILITRMNSIRLWDGKSDGWFRRQIRRNDQQFQRSDRQQVSFHGQAQPQLLLPAPQSKGMSRARGIILLLLILLVVFLIARFIILSLL